MNGMVMMFKSLGIDPEALTKTAAEMGAVIVRIEQAQARIEGKLDAVMTALKIEHKSSETENDT